MKSLTIKAVKNYLTENYGAPRHNVKCMIIAARKTAKKYGLKAIDVFFLAIENKPIKGAYTHSYGFHTATGRAIIDNFSNTYNNANN